MSAIVLIPTSPSELVQIESALFESLSTSPGVSCCSRKFDLCESPSSLRPQTPRRVTYGDTRPPHSDNAPQLAACHFAALQ